MFEDEEDEEEFNIDEPMEDVEDGPLEPAYENDLDIAQETIGAVMNILRQQSLEVEKRRCTSDFTYCSVSGYRVFKYKCIESKGFLLIFI